MKRIVGLGPALLAVAAITAFAGERQVKIKSIPSMRDPVVITRVTVRNRQIQCGVLAQPGGLSFEPVTPFQEDDNWLENTDIYLFNRTVKTIVAGRINLLFPETGTPEVMTHLDFGIVPANVFLSDGRPFPHQRGEQAVSLGPNQTFVIHVGEYGARLKAVAEDMHGNGPTQVVITEGSFFFSDGMRWSAPYYYAPDPHQPGQTQRMDALFFPGDREDNWPVPGVRSVGPRRRVN